MKTYRSTDGQRYVVRLDRGEELVRSLADLVTQEQLPGGGFTGIGAVRDTELGYFDLQERSYSRRTFAQAMELLALTGNIAWADDEPVIHAHAVLGGPDHRTVGGHLFTATIAVTGEIVVTVLPGERIERGLDQETGLKLLR